jgi:hypothetical protein
MGKTRNPSILLFLAGIVICLLFSSPILAMDGESGGRQPAWEEPDVDRPGSDFKILWLQGGLAACQEACAQNPLCKSYTYVRDGVAGRIEGCWLKSGVPLPVEDGCCVSGVKTEETVSRVVRIPVFPAGGRVKPPDDSAEPSAAPEPMPAKPEKPEIPELLEERIPVSGSGNRTVTGLDFTAVPPEMAKAASDSPPVAISPSAAEAGTGGAGRRWFVGMDFSAAPSAPPSATTRRTSESVTVTIPGTGRRNIRGIDYRALPLSVKKPLSVTKPEAMTRRIRSATRKVTGVDIRAVPPE